MSQKHQPQHYLRPPVYVVQGPPPATTFAVPVCAENSTTPQALYFILTLLTLHFIVFAFFFKFTSSYYTLNLMLAPALLATFDVIQSCDTFKRIKIRKK